MAGKRDTGHRVMVEFTSAEADAVSAFLNGLGWGHVDAVREIVSAREKLDRAIRIEQNEADRRAA